MSLDKSLWIKASAKCSFVIQGDGCILQREGNSNGEERSGTPIKCLFIPMVDNYKYLVTVFDNGLSFQADADAIAKVQRRLYVLRNIN